MNLAITLQLIITGHNCLTHNLKRPGVFCHWVCFSSTPRPPFLPSSSFISARKPLPEDGNASYHMHHPRALRSVTNACQNWPHSSGAASTAVRTAHSRTSLGKIRSIWLYLREWQWKEKPMIFFQRTAHLSSKHTEAEKTFQDNNQQNKKCIKIYRHNLLLSFFIDSPPRKNSKALCNRLHTPSYIFNYLHTINRLHTPSYIFNYLHTIIFDSLGVYLSLGVAEEHISLDQHPFR